VLWTPVPGPHKQLATFCLRPTQGQKSCFPRMAADSLTKEQSSARPTRLRRWAIKLASLILAGLVFGWGYDWAAPRFYRPEQVAGFWHGTLHGALMPIALPSLLMGKDVPIYAANSTGRSYKLGYIAGINGCGFVFFGLAFRRPNRRRQEPQANSPDSFQ